jgi:GH15 family glucan-1,4-alpha-glucosidase
LEGNPGESVKFFDAKRFRMVCAPSYGRAKYTVTKKANSYLFSPREGKTPPLPLRLRTDIPAQIKNGAVVGEFNSRSGESAAFILEESLPGEQSLSDNPDYVSAAFKETMNYWLSWIGRSNYRGRWHEMVNRSALTLKMLTYLPEGSIVAAPTFGLPERIGGERNWDYRYAWIRDAIDLRRPPRTA